MVLVSVVSAILPSKNEGFPVVLIEAQATGLITLASDRVPKETAATNLIKYISIESADIWCDLILSLDFKKNRVSKTKAIEEAGFDIKSQAFRYSKWLKQVCCGVKES